MGFKKEPYSKFCYIFKKRPNAYFLTGLASFVLSAPSVISILYVNTTHLLSGRCSIYL